MSDQDKQYDLTGPESPHFVAVRNTDAPQALTPWEQVEAGRFMPRRVRGSFRGRALG